MAKKILIVEDNQDLAEMYKMAFESAGFNVELCLDAMNAVHHLSTFHPDVVLLDIMMPMVSGFDFLKTARKKDSKVKIIVNSNLSQKKDIDMAKEMGADDYLRKSDLTPKELVQKVKKVI